MVTKVCVSFWRHNQCESQKVKLWDLFPVRNTEYHCFYAFKCPRRQPKIKKTVSYWIFFSEGQTVVWKINHAHGYTTYTRKL